MKMDITGSITRKEAIDLIFSKWEIRRKIEEVCITDALNRVLAEDVYSINTLPLVRSSKSDGIAVKSSEFINGIPDSSNWVNGVDYVRADTGDDFSDDFDAVIAIEDVKFNENGGITLSEDVVIEKNSNVNPSGHLVRKDELLVKAKTCLKPIHLTILATGGVEKVKVIKKPKVGYIPTGSELVPLFTPPKRGQNIESNGLMIRTMLEELGAEFIYYPITNDDLDNINNKLEKALNECDIILINGGTSKGEEDYNTRLLKIRNSLIQHYILAAPGPPLGIGIENNIPIINVPGPTIGAFYGMDWCVAALVNEYLNKPMKIREKVKVELLAPTKGPGFMEFFQRMKVYKDDSGNYFGQPLSWDDGNVGMIVEANGLYISPIGKGACKKGDTVEVELLYGQELVKTI